MSDAAGLEPQFPSFQPQLKEVLVAMDGSAGWPSPTSIAGVAPVAQAEPSPCPSPESTHSATLDPPSFSLGSSSSSSVASSSVAFPTSQGFFVDPSSAPMAGSWAFGTPTVQFPMQQHSMEPMPMHHHHSQHHSQHRLQIDNRRMYGVTVDEELEADARMLREVLATPATPATPSSGLQLLFVPPAQQSPMQQQPMSSASFVPSFPTSFLPKKEDFAMRPLLSSHSMEAHMGVAKTHDALTFASLLKADEHASPMQQQVMAAASAAPAISPVVTFSAGVAPLPIVPSASALKKKRSSATRICKVEGCTKGIRSRGLCKAHGGGRRCTTPGCTTSDQGGGHCVLHGGGRRCSVEGCTKSAQWRGVCKMHGGARRCRYGNCTKNGQVKQGYCRMHHNLVTLQRQQQLEQQQQGIATMQQPGGDSLQQQQHLAM